MIGPWRNTWWLARAVFVAGNVMVAAAVIGLVIVPAVDFFAARDNRIAEQRALLARLQGIIAQEAHIEAIARETETQTQAGEFLRGPNEGVISADLQTRLKTMAETAGARLRSVQALPAADKDQIRYIGARMELSGPIQTILRAVQAVEAGKPYLFVTGAALKSSPMTSQPGSPAQEPMIDAQVDIYGAVQVEARSR